MHSIYPGAPAARSRWILQQRGKKNVLDTSQPNGFLLEQEVGPDGVLWPTATILLTNRECPWRCLMCDLWRSTLDVSVPAGAIPAQIAYALDRLPAARQLKLYNAGSFFDPAAIPPEDYAAIARLCDPFERVVVECHPRLVGERCRQFRTLIAGELEVAIGLETADDETLEALNKRFTVADFRTAAGMLRRMGAHLRVFLMVQPPFVCAEEAVNEACRSLDEAFAAGAAACALIPTRDGNGAMEALRAAGEWTPPTLPAVERAMEYGLALHAGRVFTDLWDIERFFTCACSPQRAVRLAEMNRVQALAPPVACERCEYEPTSAAGSSARAATANA